MAGHIDAGHVDAGHLAVGRDRPFADGLRLLVAGVATAFTDDTLFTEAGRLEKCGVSCGGQVAEAVVLSARPGMIVDAHVVAVAGLGHVGVRACIGAWVREPRLRGGESKGARQNTNISDGGGRGVLV